LLPANFAAEADMVVAQWNLKDSCRKLNGVLMILLYSWALSMHPLKVLKFKNFLFHFKM
jgi:hypothetical protein